MGLIVVHGIGEHAREDTAKEVVRGLESAYGAGTFIQTGDVWVWTTTGDPRPGHAAEVRIYEAYCMKKLSGTVVWAHRPEESCPLVAGTSDDPCSAPVLTPSTTKSPR